MLTLALVVEEKSRTTHGDGAESLCVVAGMPLVACSLVVDRPAVASRIPVGQVLVVHRLGVESMVVAASKLAISVEDMLDVPD